MPLGDYAEAAEVSLEKRHLREGPQSVARGALLLEVRADNLRVFVGGRNVATARPEGHSALPVEADPEAMGDALYYIAGELSVWMTGQCRAPPWT